MARLTSAREVVDALGGISAVADLTGRKYNAVSNWNAADSFPSDTFVLMTAKLAKLGHRAPESLWRMVVPANRERASA